MKIPLMLVVGDQELESKTVTPRLRRGSDQSAEPRPLDALARELGEAIAERRAVPLS
jgi:threonyl-tRNA synthetase